VAFLVGPKLRSLKDLILSRGPIQDRPLTRSFAVPWESRFDSRLESTLDSVPTGGTEFQMARECDSRWLVAPRSPSGLLVPERHQPIDLGGSTSRKVTGQYGYRDYQWDTPIKVAGSVTVIP
jgi:hypothetical protein